jgi:hypothetical protein
MTLLWVAIAIAAVAYLFDLVGRHFQAKRDRAARDVLGSFDFNKEREDILALSERLVPDESRCPRCGGALLRRRGYRGPFIGCSHYPECRFTKDI